jgi:hypothetical protein
MPPPSPRPRPRRLASNYSDTPRSTAPPPVPEVPSPQSPPVTWSSTRTYVSSEDAHSRRTSQSSYDAASSHWASYIFGGDKWRSRYRANQQQLYGCIPERLSYANADQKSRAAATRCKGEVQADAKLILQEEGFVPLESVYVQPPPSIPFNLTNTLPPQPLLRQQLHPNLLLAPPKRPRPPPLHLHQRLGSGTPLLQPANPPARFPRGLHPQALHG